MTAHSESTKVLGKVLTYNPATNKNEFLDYTDRSVHTEHGKMYKIVTRCGYSVTATDDHSLATNGAETWFEPLPPQHAKGRFIPIIAKLDYPIDKAEEEKAIAIMVNALTCPDSAIFDNYMLSLPITFLYAITLSLFTTEKSIDKGYVSYVCRDKKECNIARLVCARLGFMPSIKEIDGKYVLCLDIASAGMRMLPDHGKLIAEATVEAENPSNPYLSLPYTWDEVVDVTEVEREDVTYDFTVPEFPLFIANGILVYDTMQLHVPATEAARTEALDKMLPSKNLFSPRTMSPTMLPQQEHIFGLFLASKDIPTFDKNTKFTQVSDPQKLLSDITMGTIKPNAPVTYRGHKTTAGLVVVNECLPETLRKYEEVWVKKTVTNILSQIGKTQSDKYADAADTIKEVGSLLAYKMGASYKMTDFNLKSLKAKRNAYFTQIDKELQAVDKGPGTAEQKEQAKAQLLRKAQTFAQDLTSKETANTFNQLAYSGSKGSPSQVMQIMTSPTVVADPKDRLIPMLIHNSYLEGLTPADYFVSSYGTRKGTVGAKLSVAPAGALAKEIVGNVLDIVISKKDCGTRRGITRNIEETQDIINRVEAGTNKFIDANYYEALKKQGKKQVVVRSPATCECRDGMCQFCYGYNEKLKFPEIGENVGVVSAQAITEPLTQMGLSSKHSAGTAAGEAVGFNTVKSFFNMSTKFSGSAVISEVTGNVTKIEPSPSGGTNVYIGTKKYYVPPMRKITVSIGQHVAAGDPITDGILNMGKVVPYKGIDQGRASFINSAHNLYRGAGVDSVKKNFEVVSRGLINYVQIDDPGDFDDLVEGDVVEYNQLMADIRMNPSKKKPTFTPFQKGTNKAPTYKKDWLANFGFKYLKGELIENAATHASSPTHSYHPIPSYARGAGFGKGTDGRY